MPEIDIQPTTEDIRGILLVSPIWDSLLWDAIQEGDYDSVESRFKDLLKGEYSAEEWGLVYWDGILSGIETFREDVDILTWNSLVLPALSRGILKAATPSNLETIYRALPLNRARSFYSLLISSIPEKGGKTKSDWLKDENPDLFRFLNANPGGLSFNALNKGLGIQRGIERVQILPENLSSLLFSPETAKIVNQIGEENKLSEEQIHNIATICGDVILGITRFSDLTLSIQEKLGLPEDKSLLLLKSLEEKILAPIKKDIEFSYTVPASPLQPLKESPSGNRLEAVTVNEGRTSKEVAPLPSSPRPSSSSSPIIPKTLNQQPESFFKPRPTEPEKNSGEPTVGPIIIHQETKAESIATAPKLGFRTSENKLPGAKDRPEPLRAAELTMSGGPDSHALGREDDTSKQKTESVPVLPLGAKFTIPKVIGTSSEKDASKENSSGFLGKIKNVFSKEDPLKTSVPTPPIPPTTTPPVAQLQNISREMTPPVTINIPIKKDIDIKPITQSPTPEKQEVAPISPLPVVQKEKAEEIILPKPTVVTPPAPPAKIPTINPISIPAEKTKSSILPQSTPATAPKVDLKKVTDISIKEIPSTPEEKKPGFFSKLFKRSESKKITTFATKEISPPASMPTAKTISQPTSTPSPLPPPPPAPVQSAPLPKNISGFSPQPLPTQKVSPLIGFKEKGSVSPNIPPIPQKLEEKNVIKTNDIITTPSKVVNYSEYPVSEKNQN